jgi:hypothetical protein
MLKELAEKTCLPSKAIISSSSKDYDNNERSLWYSYLLGPLNVFGAPLFLFFILLFYLNF